MTWATFLKVHWQSLAAMDFTTVEVWTYRGLVTYHILFVMELCTRRVHIAGFTPNPDKKWMVQVARNLTDCMDDFLADKRYLILDRDGKYCPAFLEIIENEGTKPVKLPPRSPNLNAYAERFVRSLKEECLSRMILFGEGPLRNAINEYIAHCHSERNHQGLENRIIDPADHVGKRTGTIRCRERLGGMLKYYYREAA